MRKTIIIAALLIAATAADAKGLKPGQDFVCQSIKTGEMTNIIFDTGNTYKSGGLWHVYSKRGQQWFTHAQRKGEACDTTYWRNKKAAK